MCGFIGGLWLNRPNDLTSLVRESLKMLSHRGPDDEDYCIGESSCGVFALGHRRLAIIDLTAAGRQPMRSGDGRYYIVYNGEIYNYKEIRRDLELLGFTFDTCTDTEVLLNSWICWKEKCLKRFEGMFSFVIYDIYESTFFCARDPFGIKPFFYFLNDNAFGFSSEIPSLINLMDKKVTPNVQRCYDYLIHGEYDSNEETFFEEIYSLLPGHTLTFDSKKHTIQKKTCWWKPNAHEKHIEFNDAVSLVRKQFLHNIQLHLRSDVLIGSALSGGIDSSSIACAIRHLEPDADIHTFSFIAGKPSLSEEIWVDRVNQAIGAISHKVHIASSELFADLDDMVAAQGEPFGSTSIYAQYRVARLAKECGVTVMLDGQGADELLAGYLGYPGHRLLSLLEKGEIYKACRFVKKWADFSGRSIAYPVMWLGRIVLPHSLYSAGRKISGKKFTPSWLNSDLLEDSGVIYRENRPILNKKFYGRRVVEQLANSLIGRGLVALLRHADRNSMRFSIESRVPFLTNYMAEILLSLPESYLISNEGETKCIFRSAMRGIVPDVILDRKDKIGFSTPESDIIFNNITIWRKLLKESSCIDMINCNELLKEFDRIVSTKSYSALVWRWINFTKWYTRYF